MCFFVRRIKNSYSLSALKKVQIFFSISFFFLSVSFSLSLSLSLRLSLSLSRSLPLCLSLSIYVSLRLSLSVCLSVYLSFGARALPCNCRANIAEVISSSTDGNILCLTSCSSSLPRVRLDCVRCREQSNWVLSGR